MPLAATNNYCNHYYYMHHFNCNCFNFNFNRIDYSFNRSFDRNFGRNFNCYYLLNIDQANSFDHIANHFANNFDHMLNCSFSHSFDHNFDRFGCNFDHNFDHTNLNSNHIDIASHSFAIALPALVADLDHHLHRNFIVKFAQLNPQDSHSHTF
jgi:hypothetical protein